MGPARCSSSRLCSRTTSVLMVVAAHRKAHLLFLLAELVGKRLGAAEAERRHLVEVGGNLVDAAYPLQQGRVRSSADTGHAGNVVHLVPISAR